MDSLELRGVPERAVGWRDVVPPRYLPGDLEYLLCSLPKDIVVSECLLL